MPVEAFRIAGRNNPRLKLLLREPPPDIAHQLANAADRDRFIVLPATHDPAELSLTMASLDVVLHTSLMGESFGYGIAEPMNYGKPVITNSTPWLDQAQVELVKHGQCGFIASTPVTIAEAILRLANEPGLRAALGRQAKAHIRALASPQKSIERLTEILEAAILDRDNPYAGQDADRARRTAQYLNQYQFGSSWREQLALRPTYFGRDFISGDRLLKPASALPAGDDSRRYYRRHYSI